MQSIDFTPFLNTWAYIKAADIDFGHFGAAVRYCPTSCKLNNNMLWTHSKLLKLTFDLHTQQIPNIYSVSNPEYSQNIAFM